MVHKIHHIGVDPDMDQITVMENESPVTPEIKSLHRNFIHKEFFSYFKATVGI